MRENYVVVKENGPFKYKGYKVLLQEFHEMSPWVVPGFAYYGIYISTKDHYVASRVDKNVSLTGWKRFIDMSILQLEEVE